MCYRIIVVCLCIFVSFGARALRQASVHLVISPLVVWGRIRRHWRPRQPIRCRWCLKKRDVRGGAVAQQRKIRN